MKKLLTALSFCFVGNFYAAEDKSKAIVKYVENPFLATCKFQPSLRVCEAIQLIDSKIIFNRRYTFYLNNLTIDILENIISKIAEKELLKKKQLLLYSEANKYAHLNLMKLFVLIKKNSYSAPFRPFSIGDIEIVETDLNPASNNQPEFYNQRIELGGMPMIGFIEFPKRKPKIQTLNTSKTVFAFPARYEDEVGSGDYCYCGGVHYPSNYN